DVAEPRTRHRRARDGLPQRRDRPARSPARRAHARERAVAARGAPTRPHERDTRLGHARRAAQLGIRWRPGVRGRSMAERTPVGAAITSGMALTMRIAV